MDIVWTKEKRSEATSKIRVKYETGNGLEVAFV
jgi:hypothetical protein